MSDSFLGDFILVVTPALLAVIGAWIIFKIRPAAKDDATRIALHKLEYFCPPKWGQVETATARRILSALYRDLQYASRGNSFIITRAAAWRMDEYLRDPARQHVLEIDEASHLYVWKTLIACALGNQHGMPVWQGRSQRRFKKRLRKVTEETIWVLRMFNHMNRPPYQIPVEMFDKVETFRDDLLNADKSIPRTSWIFWPWN